MPGTTLTPPWDLSRPADEGDGQVGDGDGGGDQRWCHLLAAVACPPVGITAPRSNRAIPAAVARPRGCDHRPIRMPAAAASSSPPPSCPTAAPRPRRATRSACTSPLPDRALPCRTSLLGGTAGGAVMAEAAPAAGAPPSRSPHRDPVTAATMLPAASPSATPGRRAERRPEGYQARRYTLACARRSVVIHGCVFCLPTTGNGPMSTFRPVADRPTSAPRACCCGIGGERELTERTLDHLSGWRGVRRP